MCAIGKNKRDAVGPRLAWRGWVVREGRLQSVHQKGTPWTRTPKVADAVPRWDELCVTTNSNGLYAFSTRKGMMRDKHLKNDYYSMGDSVVRGLVLLTGAIVQHQRGYRAERAQIVGLCDKRWARKLGVDYIP